MQLLPGIVREQVLDSLLTENCHQKVLIWNKSTHSIKFKGDWGAVCATGYTSTSRGADGGMWTTYIPHTLETRLCYMHA